MATSPAQRRLAAALKQLRARSGLSAAELGRVLGWTQTRVSRAENCSRRVSVAEATRWTDATSAPPDLRGEVIALAEDAARDVRSWWNVHAGGMVGRQHGVAALEASATIVRNCQLMIPGLLQTAEYARQAMALTTYRRRWQPGCGARTSCTTRPGSLSTCCPSRRSACGSLATRR